MIPINELLSFNSNAGAVRTDGIGSIMIAWWVKNGGLKDLESVAEKCDFSNAKNFTNNVIGLKIVGKRNYFKEMMHDFFADPFHLYIIELMGVKEDKHTVANGYVLDWSAPENNRIIYLLSYKLEETIGYTLKTSAWWSNNIKHITKERKDNKSVAKVMES